MDSGVGTTCMSAEALRAQIAAAEADLASLRQQLAAVESCQVRHGEAEEEAVAAPAAVATQTTTAPTATQPQDDTWKWPLSAAEYERYGRQLLIPSIGVAGQLRLSRSSVLIVGAGGLGCPAAAYLAAAGVGRVGICDGDVVEASNLHRQIGHATARVGLPKADSLVSFLRGINPTITYEVHPVNLTATIAEEIVSKYDVVLDCTDHPAARYLISDASVLLGRPLVSASALRTDGQLIVLNYPPSRPRQQQQDQSGEPLPAVEAGPCYRCVFPRPPPPDSVVSCGEGGILGPVVGVMGVLQALEALRLLASPPTVDGAAREPSMLLFSSTAAGPSFRTVRLRGRRKDCIACGDGVARDGTPRSPEEMVTLDRLREGLVDYVAFCGRKSDGVEVLTDSERVTVMEYVARQRDADGRDRPHLLLDVREKELFDMGSMPGAINLPFSAFQAKARAMKTAADLHEQLPGIFPNDPSQNPSVFVVCRVGNDSQVVARRLKELGLDKQGETWVGDIIGGIHAWKRDIDPTIPFM